eukprot:2664575-Prymnesium_polylepis.1
MADDGIPVRGAVDIRCLRGSDPRESQALLTDSRDPRKRWVQEPFARRLEVATTKHKLDEL